MNWKRAALIIAALVLAPVVVVEAANVALVNGFKYVTQSSVPVTASASKPVHWDDTATVPNMRFSDGTSDNYVAAIPATTKGDLAVFNGTNWVKLGVGSNTQVLTADSTQASGIKWAAGGGGGVSASSPNTWSALQTYNDGTFKQLNAGGTFGSTMASLATAARVWSFPDATDTAVGLTATQTLTNKTLTSPVIASQSTGATTGTLTTTVASGNNGYVINHTNGSNDPILVLQQGGTNQWYLKAFGANGRMGCDSGKTTCEYGSPSFNSEVAIANSSVQLLAGSSSFTLTSTGAALSGVAFASLGTPANGTLQYCNDCTIANPCASGGTGAFAKRLNGVWVCN